MLYINGCAVRADDSARVAVYQSTAIDMPPMGDSLVTFDTIVKDVFGEMSGSKFYPIIPGRFLLEGEISLDGAAGLSSYVAKSFVDGADTGQWSTYIDCMVSSQTLAYAFVVDLLAGQYAAIYQTNGKIPTAKCLAGKNRLTITRVG